MKISNRGIYVGIAFMIIGILVLLEQYLVYNEIFNYREILHHETFALTFLISGFTLLLAKMVNK